MCLPVLESVKANSGESPISATTSAPDGAPPRRMIGICNNLGLLPSHFFPKSSSTGKDFEFSQYLNELSGHRERLTVMSGVSHPGVDGSHASDVSFLSAAPHPGSGGFKNSISLDQLVARHVGHLTRFPSMTLGVNASPGRKSLSWTESGVLIPCETRASEVYRKLFISGSQSDIEKQIHRLKLGQSIMDRLADQTSSLLRKVSSRDKDRIDQYMTSVREVENRLHQAEAWEKRPKPETSEKMPSDPSNANEYMAKTRLMYRMAKLAFETDSTRSISLLLDSTNSPAIRVDGARITDGYHNLSHHGKNPDKLRQLENIDQYHMVLLNEFLNDLAGVKEPGGSLLDHSLVLYGSNLGDANKHTTDNMPVLLAGGRVHHAGHLAFDRNNNYPLPKLYVTMLQSMGLELGKFASTSGTMRGIDIIS